MKPESSLRYLKFKAKSLPNFFYKPCSYKNVWNNIFNFIYLEHEKLKKSTLIAQQKTLPRGWKVFFKIYPSGTVKGWANILYATIFGRRRKYGSRIPAIWFRSRTTKLYICSAVNRNKDYCYTSTPIPLHKTSSITVQQIQSKKNYQYYYQIFINGKRVVNILNKNAQVFKNVKYYASNPWHNPARATINHFNLAVFKHKGKVYNV